MYFTIKPSTLATKGVLGTCKTIGLYTRGVLDCVRISVPLTGIFIDVCYTLIGTKKFLYKEYYNLVGIKMIDLISDHNIQAIKKFKFNFKYPMLGIRSFLIKEDINLKGIKSKQFIDLLRIRGIKKLNTLVLHNLIGIKEFKLNQINTLIGKKLFQYISSQDLIGIKQIKLEDTLKITGRKDIINILMALDLLGGNEK